jgi:hypothetical protein
VDIFLMLKEQKDVIDAKNFDAEGRDERGM